MSWFNRGVISSNFLLFSCGQSVQKLTDSTKSSNTSTSFSPNTATDAKTMYESNSSPSLALYYDPMIYGGSTEQKNSQSGFCRKSGAVVPNPVYSYECWQIVLMGQQAQNQFNSLGSSKSIRLVNESGATVSRFDEVINSGQSTICQKIYVNTGFSYYCFNKN